MLAGAQNSTDWAGQTTVLAFEHVRDQAQERGDVKALTALFDNSLIYIDYDGTLLTKAEHLARVKANHTHIEEIVGEQMSVQVLADTAIVLGSYRLKGIENGNPYLRRGRFTDTWVRTDTNWICVAAPATPLYGHMDPPEG